jgi:hypothetical protein
MEMYKRLAVVLVRDLMLRSKIRETVQGMDRAVVFAKSPDEALATMSSYSAAPGYEGLFVVDLGQFHSALSQFAPYLSPSAPWGSVGFYSHVQTDVMETAREAGVKVVVPRSKFFSAIEEFFSNP